MAQPKDTDKREEAGAEGGAKALPMPTADDVAARLREDSQFRGAVMTGLAAALKADTGFRDIVVSGLVEKLRADKSFLDGLRTEAPAAKEPDVAAVVAKLVGNKSFEDLVGRSTANAVSKGDVLAEIVSRDERIRTVLRGQAGPAGKDGRDGKDGEPGKQGPAGAVGPKGDKGDGGLPAGMSLRGLGSRGRAALAGLILAVVCAVCLSLWAVWRVPEAGPKWRDVPSAAEQSAPAPTAPATPAEQSAPAPTAPATPPASPATASVQPAQQPSTPAPPAALPVCSECIAQCVAWSKAQAVAGLDEAGLQSACGESCVAGSTCQ